MTEETTTQEAPATDDFISAIQEGFDSLTEKEEAAPAEDNAEQEEGQEAEELSADDDAQEEETPSKPLPKGRRARQEYEARLDAEKRAMKAEMEAENLRKSLELLNKPAETKATPKSDDDYLREKNIDPDTFIDDAAKAALVITMKENDALKEAIKGTQATTEEAAYDNRMLSAFNSLPPETKADVGSAINHLVETEARALLLDYPNATIEDARIAAKESLNATMMQKYKAGIDPIDWAYKVAQARAYNPKLTAKPQAGKIDVKNVAESQNRAGSPNVNKVAVASKDSTSLSADANYSKGIESIYG